MAGIFSSDKKKKEEESRQGSSFGIFSGSQKQTQATPRQTTAQQNNSLKGASGRDSISSGAGSNRLSNPAGRDTVSITGIANDFIKQNNMAYARGDLNRNSWATAYKAISDRLKSETNDKNKANHDALLKTMQAQGRKFFSEDTFPTFGSSPIRYEMMTPEKYQGNTGARPIGQKSDQNYLLNPQMMNDPASALKNPNTTWGKLYGIANQKAENEKKFLDNAYNIAGGAPMSGWSDRDIRLNQNMWNKMSEDYQNRAEQWTLNHPSGENADPNVIMAEAEANKRNEIMSRPDYEGYFTDQHMMEIDEAKNQALADAKEPKQMPAAWQNTGVFGTAGNLASYEMGRRDFQRKYVGNTLNEDWESRSQYKPATVTKDLTKLEASNPETLAEQQASMWNKPEIMEEYQNIRHEAINGDQDAIYYLTHVREAGAQNDEYSEDPFVEQYMTDEERQQYNYLWGDGTEEERAAAQEFVDGLNIELWRRAWTAADEATRARLESMPGWALVLESGIMTGIGLIENQANAILAAEDVLNGRQINPWRMSNIATTTNEVTDTRIRDWAYRNGLGDIGQNALSMIYQGAYSGLQSGLSIGFGGLTANALGMTGKVFNEATKYFSLGLMSSGAGSQTLQTELMQGVPQDRAILDAIAAGGIEFATEMIGMDNLFNGNWGGKGAFVTFLKQALAEGSEELVGDIASDAFGMIADIISNTNYSELNRQANAYILENGLAPDDRDKVMAQILTERLADYAVDFGVGSVSTFFGEGSIGMGQAYMNASTISSHVSPMQAESVWNYALENLPEDSVAYKRAAEVKDKFNTGAYLNDARGFAKDVRKMSRGVVYEVQSIEDREERKEAFNTMLGAFGMQYILTPDVQRSEPENVTGNDTISNDAVETASRAEQVTKDNQFVQNAVSLAIAAQANMTEPMQPDEVERTIDSFVKGEGTPDLSKTGLGDDTIAELNNIAERRQMTEVMDDIVNEGNTIKPTAPESTETAPEVQAEETPSEELASGAGQDTVARQAEQKPSYYNTLSDEGKRAYNQVMNEAKAVNMPESEAQTAFQMLYDAGTSQIPYLPTRGIRSLSEWTRNSVYGLGYQESLQESKDVQQRGFAKTTSAAGVARTSVVNDAIKAGTISSKTISVMDRIGKMMGVSVNLMPTMKNNGEYRVGGNTINIAMDSWFLGKDRANTDAAVLGTFGHELTHRLQDVSADLYRQFSDQVAKLMGSRDFSAKVAHAMQRESNLTPMQAQAEVIADFVGMNMFEDASFADRLLDGITANTAEQRTALQGIRDFVQKVLNWIRGNRDTLKNAKQTEEIFRNLETSLTNLIEQAAENVKTEGVEVELLPSGEHPDTGQTPQEENQYSLRYKDDIFDRVAEYNLNSGMIDEQTLSAAKKVMDDTAELLSRPDVQELIPEENKLAGVDRDAKGKKLSTMYGNESYGYTGESTTVCPRSLAMENLLDLVSRELGHSLSVQEGVAVSQLAWAYTQNPTCQYCYVWADRLQQREARANYIQMRDAALKAAGTIDANTKIVTQAALTTSTVKKNGQRTNTIFSVEDAVAKHPELEKQLRAYNEFLDGRKNTVQQKRRFIQWLTAVKNGNALVTSAQAATEGTMAQAVLDDPSLQDQIKDLYDYSLKASHAKLKVGYVAYNNDILKLSDKVINKMNENYGIRFYSYSDYHPAFVLENMQMIADASARGLKGLAYTKDLDFVRIFAGTGCGINISIKAIDGTTEMDAMQGADWEEAKALRAKKGNENVGITFIATSDMQVDWALDQDWIDTIIPYHVVFSDKVGKIFGWTNYRAMQSDKKLKGFDSSKGVKDITPPMHQNNKELYKDLCDHYNLDYRFKQWIDHPNYMKLVNETRQAEGMTRPLQPVFNMDAVKDSIDKLVKDGGYDNPYATKNQETIRELAEDITEVVRGADEQKLNDIAQGRIQLSARDTEYMELAKDPVTNRSALQRMVDEAAMRIPTIASQQRGRMVRPINLYHGTPSFGFTQFEDPRHAVPFIYTSTDRTVSANYAGNNHYAGVRDIGRKYDGGSSIQAIIKDAETVWGKKYHVATDAEKSQAFKEVRDAAVEIADRIDEVRTDFGLGWDNEDDIKVSNQIAWVENLFWVMRDSGFTSLEELMSEETGYTPEDVLNDIERFEDNIAGVKEYYQNNYSRFTTEQKKYLSYLTGYDVGDTAIDIRGKIGRILSGVDNLLTADDGWFANPQDVRESLDRIHNIGSYHLYGDLGSNPFEFDANGAQFWAVKVPEIGDDYYDTDTIVKWAYDHGYTSVIMHNIYDYGNKADNYVFFDSSQLKSADPVTYDDEGNVIPLSERFNTENQDIRYSAREENTVNDYADIIARNQQREQARALLGNPASWRQSNVKLDALGLRKKTIGMLDQFGDLISENQREKVVKDVAKLANDMLHGRETDLYDIEMRAANIASDVVFFSYGEKDAEARDAMMDDPAAEAAIDNITDYILANISGTQSYQARNLQKQIEQNKKLKDTLKTVREKRDTEIRRRIEAGKERQRAKQDSELRKSILKRGKRLEGMKMSDANKALKEQLIGGMNLDVTHLTDGQKNNITELLAWAAEQEQNSDFVMSESVRKQLSMVNQTYLDDIISKDDPDAINKLRLLNEALKELEHAIRTQNRLIDDADNRELREIAYDEDEILNNVNGTTEGWKRNLDKIFVQGTLSPMRFMHRLTGYAEKSGLYRLAKAIDEGGIKKLAYQSRAVQMFDKWMSDKKLVRSWAGKNADIKTYDYIAPDGKEAHLELTPGMRMTLYLASKDYGWMRHMCGVDTPDGHLDGRGITLPKMSSYKKGRISYSGAETYRITRSILNKIIADMSAEERAFADKANEFFNGMQKDALNATSQQLIGRDIALVDDYLPITVDDRFLGKDYGTIKMDGTVEGIGSLKERVESGAPVFVRDLTDILMQSIESTSSYVGLAVPITNFNKLMKAKLGAVDANGVFRTGETTLKNTIDAKWGDTALNYIDKMIADIQHPNYVREDLDKAFAKIRSNYARSVLTLNLSVGMKQAASYPTAAAVVGWKALSKAFVNYKHVDLDLIRKYTPLLWYRSRGFVNPELGTIKNGSVWDNLPKGLDWITGIDFLTTRKLWKAAEYYVQDAQPGLYKPGAGIYGQSNEYYEAVAEVYNQVIEETQPNYTPWQRPQYLRSHSGITQTLMMFKTQPMQNFNVLYDAIGNYRAKVREMKINGQSREVQQAYKEAGKKLRWAVTSQIGQLVTFAAMTMLWNIFRRKKEKYTDEDGNFSLEVMFQNMGKDIGSGVFGMIPFGSDAWSFISSKLFGDKYYGFESVTDSVIKDLWDSVGTAWDTMSKLLTSGEPFDLTTYKSKIKSVGTAVAKLFGIPAENVFNIMTALYKRGRDMTEDRYMADLYAMAWDTNPENNKKDFVNIAYRAYNNGDMESYGELKDFYRDEWGWDEEDVINDNLRKLYAAQFGDSGLTPAYQNLYDLYKTDEDNFLFEYNKMEELGFSEDQLKKGIESCMKEEAGVDSVNDLEERFTTPEEEIRKEEELRPLHESKAWENANEAERETLEDYADKYNNSDTKQWTVAREGVDAGALTFDEYMQFLLALSKVDQPTESGKYGSYTTDEVKAAIDEMGWTKEQARELWQYLPKYSSNNPYETVQERKKEPALETVPEPEPEPEPEPASLSGSDLNAGDLKKIEKSEDVATPESSWIRNIHYNPNTQTLTVTTNGGRTYTHSGVSKETYEDFKAAPSKGRWYNAHF